MASCRQAPMIRRCVIACENTLRPRGGRQIDSATHSNTMVRRGMSTPLVETTHGNVAGREQGAITVWKGIPYAHPPLAYRRFLPPQPLHPWSGVLDATRFGPASLQLADRGNASASDGHPTSEDCLSLN